MLVTDEVKFNVHEVVNAEEEDEKEEAREHEADGLAWTFFTGKRR